MDEYAYVYQKFNINILKTFLLWPTRNENENSLKSKFCRFAFLLSIFPVTFSLIYDLVLMVSEGDADIIEFIQCLLALIVTLASHYMCICFLENRDKIKKIISQINGFQLYCSSLDLIRVDKRSAIYSKTFLIYSVIGVLMYCLVPLMSRKECESYKTINMKKHQIPCGLVSRARYPFNFDYTPAFEIVYMLQLYLVFMVSFLMVTISMLMCGLMLHAIQQLKNLRKMVLEISEYSGRKVYEQVHLCVKYHNAIIRYAEDINRAFSTQMLMHITLTSCVISVLLFEILMVQNLTDKIRFIFHLLGWFLLLFMVCFLGQKLIDESTGVGEDAYKTLWYNCPVEVQKDISIIIIRAQQPLNIDAVSISSMSLPTYLKILSSAYSYFTLLVKLRSN